MTSPAGILVFYIVNKIGIGKETLLLTRWAVPYPKSYNLPVSPEKQPLAEDTARIHEEIFVAIFFGILVLAAIAIMESESRKHNVIPILPFNRKSEKENTPQNSQKIKIRKVKLTRINSIEKNESLSNLDLTKLAEPINTGNISMVYKLFDKQHKPTSIFKPYDAIFKDMPEQDTPLQLSKPFHCRNEVAAYKLDKLASQQFQAGVPETSHVKLPAKIFHSTATGSVRGSLQKFEENSHSAEDYGPGMFTTADIHKIGLLDLKILNCDRHSGNILFVSEGKKLIPIDHALSFPEVEFNTPTSEGAVLSADMNEPRLLLKNVSFDWLLFPQAKMPFTRQELNEINAIDINKHIKVLSKMGMNLKQKLAICSSLMLLKEAALNHNKSLYEIGRMVQRQGRRNELSTLEILIDQAVSKCDKLKLEKYDPTESQRFCINFKQELLNFFKV